MKNIAMIIAAAALLSGINCAFAEGRKQAAMDAGKGAFKLIFSVPDFAEGPYDFSGNQGPVVNELKGKLLIGEAMFKSGFSKTSNVFYLARIDRSYVVDTEEQRIYSDKLAKLMIKNEGFEGREQKIPCPPSSLDSAEMTCYKFSGSAIFNGRIRNSKDAGVVASVSFGNGKMGYSIMGLVTEKDIAKFDADVKTYEQIALNAVGEIYRNHRINKN